MGRNPYDRIMINNAFNWPTNSFCFVFFHWSWLICVRHVFRNQKSILGHQSQPCWFLLFFFFLWGAVLYTDLLFSMCITFRSSLPAATLAPPTSPRHMLLVSVWHRWHSYRQLMCERVRPMPVALSCCSPRGPFTLHFCQMCNTYSLLSLQWGLHDSCRHAAGYTVLTCQAGMPDQLCAGTLKTQF